MAGDAAATVARFDRLKGERGTSETTWQMIADYMLPSREYTRRSAPGSRRTMNLIYNTTAVLALEQLAGALHGMLTSPSLRWFALRPSDPLLAADDNVRAWFEFVTDEMYAVFANSEAGFDTALHEVYLELAGPGTGVLYMPDKGRRGPAFQARPLAECYIDTNADGQVDTVFRAYDLSARSILSLWEDTAPEAVRRAAETNPGQTFQIIHAVEPSRDRPDEWDETYCLAAPQACLEEGRYQTFPYAVPRWMKRSGEKYGTGPALHALPDVKLVNKLEELVLRGLEKVVDPALMLPDDGFLDAPLTRPGAINYFRSGAPNLDKIGALPTGARPDIGADRVQQIEARIKRVFYVDWMNLPIQPNMTATEVLQRRDEMLRLLGPMVARVTAELLGPIIRRTFHIMAANGMLPPAPAILRGAGYTVEYLSPLATAQRAADAETIMKWLAGVMQLAQVDPSVAEVIDAEKAARFLGARYGAPASVVRSPEEIAARREALAQQQQQAHEAEMAQSAATTADRGTNALARMAEMIGGAGPGNDNQVAA